MSTRKLPVHYSWWGYYLNGKVVHSMFDVSRVLVPYDVFESAKYDIINLKLF